MTRQAERDSVTDATPDRRGRLVVLSAPSGAGKTTLVRELLACCPELRLSISYTTRPARPGEVHGRDYYFVDEPAFLAMIEAGEFLEHARVFGNRYGTSRAQIGALLDQGQDVLLEIDWQGARQIRSNAPGCCTVFMLPPSLAELERRLRGRGTDTEEVIQRRLAQARDDMDHWDEFDHVVINERIPEATAYLAAILRGEDPGSSTRLPALRERVAALLAPA